jgi:hypothetical protein
MSVLVHSVVDALDECDNEYSIRIILQLLAEARFVPGRFSQDIFPRTLFSGHLSQDTFPRTLFPGHFCQGRFDTFPFQDTFPSQDTFPRTPFSPTSLASPRLPPGPSSPSLPRTFVLWPSRHGHRGTAMLEHPGRQVAAVGRKESRRVSG